MNSGVCKFTGEGQTWEYTTYHDPGIASLQPHQEFARRSRRPSWCYNLVEFPGVSMLSLTTSILDSLPLCRFPPIFGFFPNHASDFIYVHVTAFLAVRRVHFYCPGTTLLLGATFRVSLVCAWFVPILLLHLDISYYYPLMFDLQQ
jgi:hypothetical protein